MRDLVRRLRDPAFGTETSERNLMNQAADRIAQLESALREIKRGAVWNADIEVFISAALGEERT